ncbi:hypothetical protein K438DRAFT_1779555 [Mycena galopus ATCC 62051]|nr:hypothetical protein K438DRAFT_1779555 [Mycena galopus ATCC 62051]
MSHMFEKRPFSGTLGTNGIAAAKRSESLSGKHNGTKQGNEIHRDQENIFCEDSRINRYDSQDTECARRSLKWVPVAKRRSMSSGVRSSMKRRKAASLSRTSKQQRLATMEQTADGDVEAVAQWNKTKTVDDRRGRWGRLSRNVGARKMVERTSNSGTSSIPRAIGEAIRLQCTSRCASTPINNLKNGDADEAEQAVVRRNNTSDVHPLPTCRDLKWREAAETREGRAVRARCGVSGQIRESAAGCFHITARCIALRGRATKGMKGTSEEGRAVERSGGRMEEFKAAKKNDGSARPQGHPQCELVPRLHVKPGIHVEYQRWRGLDVTERCLTSPGIKDVLRIVRSSAICGAGGAWWRTRRPLATSNEKQGPQQAGERRDYVRWSSTVQSRQ